MSLKIIKCSGNQDDAYFNKKNTRASRSFVVIFLLGVDVVNIVCVCEQLTFHQDLKNRLWF